MMLFSFLLESNSRLHYFNTFHFLVKCQNSYRGCHVLLLYDIVIIIHLNYKKPLIITSIQRSQAALILRRMVVPPSCVPHQIHQLVYQHHFHGHMRCQILCDLQTANGRKTGDLQSVFRKKITLKRPKFKKKKT